MHRTTVTTAAVSTGLAAAAALALSAPALADDVTRSSGPLVRLSEDRQLLPDGAEARVQYVPTADGRTRVTLHVTGLKPGHTYGAHAHVADCMQNGGGGHYQHVPVAAGGAIDADNEIWLDLTTNAAGNGHSSAVQDWQIAPARQPRSVIIHALPTSTGTPERPAGTAGPKLACLQSEL